jgi:hypothetical protein
LCIPFKVFKRIYGPDKLKRLLEKQLHIKMQEATTYLVPMQIMGRKVMHDLVVLKNVQDNILGIDFIREHFLSCNSFTDKCFWETSPIHSGQLKAAERMYINTLSSRKNNLRCVDDNNTMIGINNQMIATISSPHTLISGPPGIIKFDNEGIAYTVIQNCAP